VTLDEFLLESQYQVWADDYVGLLKFAQYLSKNDKVAVATHSFGRGFNQSYAFLSPLFKDGQFVIVMSLTKSRKVFDRLMPTVGATETVKQLVAGVLPDL